MIAIAIVAILCTIVDRWGLLIVAVFSALPLWTIRKLMFDEQGHAIARGEPSKLGAAILVFLICIPLTLAFGILAILLWVLVTSLVDWVLEWCLPR